MRLMLLERRLGACLLCVVLLLTVLVPAASAEAEPPPENAQVGAAFLGCLDNNQILYEKNADVMLYPASTVKIMTGLLACRYLADRLNEPVTLTAGMLAGVSGRSLHLAEGETVTVNDLLYAALCGCYNDAACALAVLVSGSVADFVTLMNREAERLGAVHTKYTNPTGLHDDGMVTTLRDTVLVAREAYASTLFMTVTSATVYTIPPTQASPAREIYNRNLLLSDSSQVYRNGYCLGMSAGMTDEGGWCVVTVYRRGGATLLCAVMQGMDVQNGEVIPAYSFVNTLLYWARTNYGFVEVLAPGGTVADDLPVGMTGISSSRAELIIPDGLSVYLPLDVTADDVTVSWTLTGAWEDGHLTAPLTAGEEVGLVSVFYGGEVVGTAPLVITKDYARNGFMDAMVSFRDYLGSRAFVITLLCFAVMLTFYISLVRKSGGRYRARTRRPAGENPRGGPHRPAVVRFRLLRRRVRRVFRFK